MKREKKDDDLRARVGKAFIDGMDRYIADHNAKLDPDSEEKELTRSSLLRKAIREYMNNHPPESLPGDPPALEDLMKGKSQGGKKPFRRRATE